MQLFVFYPSLGLVWMSEIELSHTSNNNQYPDLVCKKNKFIFPSCTTIFSIYILMSNENVQPTKMTISF